MLAPPRRPAHTTSSRAFACWRRAGRPSSTRRRASSSARWPAGDVEAYVRAGEWQGRAGGYAIQGRGAALVDRIEGDYLNVVGLPAALLVRLLADRFPGAQGSG